MCHFPIDILQAYAYRCAHPEPRRGARPSRRNDMRASLAPWLRTTIVLPPLVLGVALAQSADVAELAYAFDTFALLMSAVLVIHMKPGFALLEAGLHGSKNAINIFMKNYATLAIAGLAFWAVGFSIMYGAPLFVAG